MSERSVINALHAAQSFGVVVPKKAFVFGHMVMLKNIFNRLPTESDISNKIFGNLSSGKNPSVEL